MYDHIRKEELLALREEEKAAVQARIDRNKITRQPGFVPGPDYDMKAIPVAGEPIPPHVRQFGNWGCNHADDQVERSRGNENAGGRIAQMGDEQACKRCGELDHYWQQCPQTQCAVCGAYGHTIRDCPQQELTKQERIDMVVCMDCGRPGHPEGTGQCGYDTELFANRAAKTEFADANVCIWHADNLTPEQAFWKE